MGAEGIREVVYRVVVRDGWRVPALVFSLIPDATTLRVETLAANLDAEGNVWRLVQVHGTPREVAAAEQSFRTHTQPSILEKGILSRARGRLVLWYKYSAETGTRGPSLTHMALKALGPETVVTDRTTADGLEVRLVTRGGSRLTRFLERLERVASVHHDYTLVYVGPPRIIDDAHLSVEEEQAVRTAQSLGFFGVPRRVGVREVALRLGCSASAASARLRRAEAKLVRAYTAAP